jgi:hypothetical protein
VNGGGCTPAVLVSSLVTEQQRQGGSGLLIAPRVPGVSLLDRVG